MKEIKNKVLKTELLKWRDLKPLQHDKLKIMTKQDFEMLKNSLDVNHFIEAMNVWESPEGDIYLLDGHHRQKVLDLLEKDGYLIPDKLPCNFIKCKDRKEAAKFLLVYSARDYARIQEEGLYEFMEMEDLQLDDFRNQLVIPDIDFDYFEESYYKDIEDVDELGIEEKNEKVNIVKCPKCNFEWVK